MMHYMTESRHLTGSVSCCTRLNNANAPHCRSPSLGSNSMSDGERQSRDDRYYANHQPPNDVAGEVPEIYIPQPEFLNRIPASELRFGQFLLLTSAPLPCIGLLMRERNTIKYMARWLILQSRFLPNLSKCSLFGRSHSSFEIVETRRDRHRNDARASPALPQHERLLLLDAAL